MTLPVVHLTGTPRAQGEQHGRQLRERIAHNLDVYFDRFAREVGLPRPEVLAWSRRYADAIERQNADYFAAMRGVADGAGFAFDEIVALNVRYEILYYQFGQNALAAQAEPDGCTAFAILPEASENGHLLLGQNWDWIPHVQGAVLHTTDPETGHETLGFTEAGIVGAKIGLSSAGVGLCINGMTTTKDDWSRLSRPVHVRCWEILRAPNLDAAMRVITDEPRACSTNFLLAGTNPPRAVDVEAAPDAARLLAPENGRLVHTNHFVDPQAAGVTETPNARRIFSCHRRDRLSALLDAKRPVAVADIENYLRDHEDYPFGVCRHENPDELPAQHYITVTAVIMDVDEKTLRLTDGPPCRNDFQTVALTTGV